MAGRGRHPRSHGGCGFAFSPEGELIAETSAVIPLVAIDIDLRQVREAQANYPCYVKELD